MPGFEAKKAPEQENRRRQGASSTGLGRRFSISAASSARAEISKHAVSLKLQKLKEQVKVLSLVFFSLRFMIEFLFSL